MTKVVVDSNFVGRGDFNSRRLKAIVSLLGETGEVIIPEVVVWEWAEHAAQAIGQLIEQTARLSVDVALYHPSAPEPGPTKEVLISAIENNLPARVSISRADSAQYAAAVRAQVLQTGTGELKSGVKTGAADHLVAECVRAQLEDRSNAEAVILASNDKRLRQVCREMLGDEVLYANGDVELVKKLVEFAPAEDELLESVEVELVHRISDSGDGIGAELSDFSMGFYFAELHENEHQFQREVPSMARVEIVELHDLQVGAFENDARIGIAHVRVFGTVHITVLQLTHVEGDREEFDWVTTYDDDIPSGYPLNRTLPGQGPARVAPPWCGPGSAGARRRLVLSVGSWPASR